jgi:GNAT superfamily N-acetyltransferase
MMSKNKKSPSKATQTNVVTFMVEPWSSYKLEAAPLWIEHYKEVAVHQDTIPLAVDYDQYEAQDQAGALLVIVARNEGKIVGYWLGFLRPHFHYKTSFTAYTDIYYLDPSLRYGGIGARMMQFVEAELKRRGVQKVFTATKVHLDHSPLFEALGYTRTEYVYTKLLED